MAGKIPQTFIDDLISRVDIIDVIDSRVPLKKAGRDYKACCPFHQEKTPSFTVSPNKQFYYCFGCGAHGTAIGFLMEFEHLSFVEAIEDLASANGLTVPREGGQKGARSVADNHTGELYGLLEQADRFYRKQLRVHPEAVRAVEYLKGRGLSGEIAAEFGIGFAPPGWHNLGKALNSARPADLVAAGLSIENDEGRRYDRFRERVMFPIHDRRGRVIGFGGRVLGDGTPKYLNSPETPVFHKGRELYGLWEARQALRQLPRLLVVEGYMDVVSLAQFGVRYAVATLGTSVTPDHLQLMFRATSEVVFCFDGDRAGRDAAWRGLEHVLPLIGEGRQVKFMFLPDGEDPDTLIREIGREGFESRVERAQPLADFVVDQLSSRADLSQIDGPARLVELARPLLSKVPVGGYRKALAENLASRARMGVAEVSELLGFGIPGGRSVPGPRRRPAKMGDDRAPSPVRHAISLLLQQPGLGAHAGSSTRFAGIPLPGAALLGEMLELVQIRPHLSTGALIEHWRERPEGPHLAKLAARELPLDDAEALQREFEETLERIEQYRLEFRRDELTRKPFRELTGAEKIELQQLLRSKTP
ncbi:DNA primase [Thiohalomonas denitrificans]|uniref:DNA primase n=1 Tax=Thiohalomonas denitrificans TaxID=415747 RepID=A0A1G5PUC6_9GAMM|nr:DNA primase [Thiohalomonas denitrificans]SCZ53017.1 DNA primase [Thiohalomonas denitrificans]